MTHEEFKKLADHLETPRRPNRLWCSPISADGH